MDPEDVTSWADLGRTFDRLGKAAEAEAALRETVRLCTGDWWLHVLIIPILWGREKPREAESQAREGLTSSPMRGSSIRCSPTSWNNVGRTEAAKHRRTAKRVRPRREFKTDPPPRR